MTADVAIEYLETFREDIDSEPIPGPTAEFVFLVPEIAAELARGAFKPGWCILHGLQEPCIKCNSHHVEEVASR